MKIIDPSVELINPVPYHMALNTIEIAGRTCYQSEDKMTEGSAEDFIRRIIKRGHESVLEHVSITARFICDRGVSHEIVRHRIGAYSQESTRYCNYSGDKFGNEITVIEPCYLVPGTGNYVIWSDACEMAEAYYFRLLGGNTPPTTPQEARAVLPQQPENHHCGYLRHPGVAALLPPPLRPRGTPADAAGGKHGFGTADQ